MVSHVDHFDTIIVSSDKEAFILEMNLIQTHYPRYNIMLMDDSHYPYIALKRKDDPYLKIARNTEDSRYFYFGPFPSSGSAYETFNLLNKIYPTRKCRTIPKKACLYYSMGQCLAPCINKIEPAVYEKLYADIKKFLNGETDEAVASIKAKMLARVRPGGLRGSGRIQERPSTRSRMSRASSGSRSWGTIPHAMSLRMPNGKVTGA
jgi:excinuclease ABC subunit C